jgi:hypothetical protein
MSYSKLSNTCIPELQLKPHTLAAIPIFGPFLILPFPSLHSHPSLLTALQYCWPSPASGPLHIPQILILIFPTNSKALLQSSLLSDALIPDSGPLLPAHFLTPCLAPFCFPSIALSTFQTCLFLLCQSVSPTKNSSFTRAEFLPTLFTDGSHSLEWCKQCTPNN